MSSLSIEVCYSRPCPLLAAEIDSRLFALSGASDGDSFTTGDAMTHSFSFNYESLLVARSALDRLRGVLRRSCRGSDFRSFDIRINEDSQSDIPGS